MRIEAGSALLIVDFFGHDTSREPLVSGPGAEDDKHPSQLQPGRLQHELAKVWDAHSLKMLEEAHHSSARQDDVDRLKDLRDESVSHAWLWSSAASSQGDLEPDEFVSAVLMRIGAQHFDEPQICQACGEHVLDPMCVHASCCAPRPSLRGHSSRLFSPQRFNS